ncbi:MAG: hypothetical protein AAF724_17085 [Pseudomonadota bacterium]
MNQDTPSTSSDDFQPLVSSRLLRKMAIWIAALGVITIVLSIGGRTIGERIVMSGHTDDTSPVSISLNGNAIVIPANAIRFENQREGGVHKRVDIYFTWPDLEGYTNENSDHFNRVDKATHLIFLSLSQRTMPMDMSARLEPVYSRLVDGGDGTKDSGLLAYAFSEDTRYSGEILYVGARDNGPAFAARCLREEGLPAGSHPCMRDVDVGRDMSVTYRFSRNLLPEWRRLDAAIKAYIDGSINEPRDKSAS